MQRILIAVDFSSHSVAAAGLGVSIARSRGADVSLLNAIELFDHISIPPGAAERIRSDAIVQCQRDLDAMALKLTSDESPVHAVCRYAEPSRAILAYAVEWEADMIVMGTRGAGANSRQWFGSVAAAVARDATCPVLITRHDQNSRYPPNGFFDHVLVAVDYSKFSVPAAKLAAELAEKESVLEMVHIYYAPDQVDDEAYQQAIAEARVQELIKLETLASRIDLAPLKVAYQASAGQVAGQLLDYIEGSKTNLLIAGAHSQNDERQKLGTVAERLLRYSAAPVVVLPERALGIYD